MLTPSASAGQEGCLTFQAEQGYEDQSLEIPGQEGGNRIKHWAKEQHRSRCFPLQGPKSPGKSISKNCLKSRKQGGAWPSLRLPLLRPKAQQCQELLQGLITRPHRECGSLSCLFQRRETGPGILCWDLACMQQIKS